MEMDINIENYSNVKWTVLLQLNIYAPMSYAMRLKQMKYNKKTFGSLSDMN
jgi:hypothetical protein